MPDYTVIGVYADNHQRYAEDVRCYSAEEAEELVTEYIRLTGEHPIVAAVVEGPCEVVR